MNMRDPAIYRIRHIPHQNAGDKWCIYPMYDYTHGQSDSIEGITHSICTLEFEDHRPLYDWFIEQLGIYAPQQIEFARLNLNYTIMSNASCCAWSKKATSPGGTTRVCPRFQGCGGAAIRRRRFERSVTALAWLRATAWWTLRCLSTACAKT